MNTDTGAIERMENLTEAERESGKWATISDDLAQAAQAVDLVHLTAKVRRERLAKERQRSGLRKPGRR